MNIGNFNSLMGIITGLNMVPVARLKKTWHKISSAGKFAVLEHQVSTKGGSDWTSGGHMMQGHELEKYRSHNELMKCQNIILRKIFNEN